jgi:hypothetical protein
MVVYAPFFQTVFKTEALHPIDWIMVVVVSTLPLWAMELVKAIHKKAHPVNPA